MTVPSGPNFRKRWFETLQQALKNQPSVQDVANKCYTVKKDDDFLERSLKQQCVKSLFNSSIPLSVYYCEPHSKVSYYDNNKRFIFLQMWGMGITLREDGTWDWEDTSGG